MPTGTRAMTGREEEASPYKSAPSFVLLKLAPAAQIHSHPIVNKVQRLNPPPILLLAV